MLYPDYRSRHLPYSLAIQTPGAQGALQVSPSFLALRSRIHALAAGPDGTTTPVVDSKAPIVDSKAPIVDSKAPVVDAKAPVLDAKAPEVKKAVEEIKKDLATPVTDSAAPKSTSAVLDDLKKDLAKPADAVKPAPAPGNDTAAATAAAVASADPVKAAEAAAGELATQALKMKLEAQAKASGAPPPVVVAPTNVPTTSEIAKVLAKSKPLEGGESAPASGTAGSVTSVENAMPDTVVKEIKKEATESVEVAKLKEDLKTPAPEPAAVDMVVNALEAVKASNPDAAAAIVGAPAPAENPAAAAAAVAGAAVPIAVDAAVPVAGNSTAAVPAAAAPAAAAPVAVPVVPADGAVVIGNGTVADAGNSTGNATGIVPPTADITDAIKSGNLTVPITVTPGSATPAPQPVVVTAPRSKPDGSDYTSPFMHPRQVRRPLSLCETIQML